MRRESHDPRQEEAVHLRAAGEACAGGNAITAGALEDPLRWSPLPHRMPPEGNGRDWAPRPVAKGSQTR